MGGKYTWAVQVDQAYPNFGATVLTRVDYSDGPRLPTPTGT